MLTCLIILPTGIYQYTKKIKPKIQPTELYSVCSRLVYVVTLLWSNISSQKFATYSKLAILTVPSIPLEVLNTSYLTDSYIVYTLKIESVPEIAIFGLKMMVKSGLEKIFWNSSMRKPFSSNSFCFIERRKMTNSVIKITIFPHGGISK